MRRKYLKPVIKKSKVSIKFLSHVRFYDSVDQFLFNSEPVLIAQGSCAGCFPAKTKILMFNKDKKQISQVRVGDQVISYDFKTSGFIRNKVEEVIVHKNYKGGYIIINEKIRLTPNHPVYCFNLKTWKPADQLSLNDQIVFENNKIVEIYSLKFIKRARITVYNLHLKHKEHNFFADGALVHNAKHDFK
ncbi:MAG: hypothetical protein KatS3mg093_453 [Candidatus Parcubacteria bacterium]|nr:MAG: hypothetical protein KatS3mg093_453 [Candidatus Parcubacteria bacterium]